MWLLLTEVEQGFQEFSETHFHDSRFLELGKRKVAELFRRYNAGHDVQIGDAECGTGMLRAWTLCTMFLEANLDGHQMPEFLWDMFCDGLDQHLFYYGSDEFARTGMPEQEVREICQARYNLLKHNPVSIGADIMTQSLADHAVILIGVYLSTPQMDAMEILKRHERDIGELIERWSRHDSSFTKIDV